MSYLVDCVRELRCGTVNIREVPGYRTELTPFGGTKDSGLGVKEGVVEAMRAMTFTKLYTTPRRDMLDTCVQSAVAEEGARRGTMLRTAALFCRSCLQPAVRSARWLSA